MSTLSHASRGFITGMPHGGGTLRVTSSDALLHVCVDAIDTQADTIYVFAQTIALPSTGGRAALLEIDVQERIEATAGVRTRLVTIEIPEPPHAPILVLNGVVKSNAARIYARAPRADVALFGYYTRQALSLAPAAHTTIGSLVLLHQTIAVSAARENVVVNPNIPVTFLISNHMSSTPGDAYMGRAQEGTYKIMTLVAKHPNASGEQGESMGNIRLSFNRFRLPDGLDSEHALGSMLFKRIGDSAQLLYSSTVGWTIVGAGVTVE